MLNKIQIILLIVLIFVVIAFVVFPFVKHYLVKKHYKKLNSFKIKTIAKRNGFSFLDNINLLSLNGNYLNIDQIIFGRKYIYLIKGYSLFGILSGKQEDNSWIHVNLRNREAKYINNFLNDGKKRIEDFSRVAQMDKELLIDIELINNECDSRLENLNTQNVFVTTPYKLNRLLRKIESRNIPDLNSEQLKIVIKEIEQINEQERRHTENI